jgi:fluoroacetyl-CoA thioesterase
MELRPGLTGDVEHTVAERDTATALGSGDVPVLGTPKVLALAEAATVAALAGALADDQTSVGTAVRLRHRAASAVGARVRARATLTAVDGAALVFDVVVHEGDRMVADGQVERAVVQRERFLRRVAAP